MAANGPSVGVVWVRCGRRPHPNQQRARNPAFGVPLPGSVRDEQIPLTREQVDDLAVAAGRDRLAILFLAYTGVRYGEMAALRVGNLNLLRRWALMAEAVVDDELQAILRAAERLVEAHSQYRPVPTPEIHHDTGASDSGDSTGGVPRRPKLASNSMVTTS